MHSVAFSSDGSLIAVGTGSCVTLWKSGDGSYIASLPAPPSLEDPSSPEESIVSLLAFVAGTPYLAGMISQLCFCCLHYNHISADAGVKDVLPSGCLSRTSPQELLAIEPS